MKAKALQLPSVREKLDLPILKDYATITPFLVLAGRAQDPSLATFAEEESLQVAVVEMEVIEKILVTEDPVKLRELAVKYFSEKCGDESLITPADTHLVKEGQ